MMAHENVSYVRGFIYLFIRLFSSSLFNYGLESVEWMTVNNELERIWKEAVVAYFKVLSWNLLGVTH
jgi:hypothetical protein